jgi:hypothetical protein
MNPPHALALDIGTRYARLAVAGPGAGPPRPVPLPGEVPGEGLPLSAGARGRPMAALREAYGAYLARYGPPTGAVVVLPRRTARELAGPATAALTAEGCQRVRVIGAAHALLALVRQTPGAAAGTGEYLVCDAGGPRGRRRPLHTDRPFGVPSRHRRGDRTKWTPGVRT